MPSSKQLSECNKYFLKYFIYLFLERREKEREGDIDVGEKHHWLPQSVNWGPGLQPRHVP